MASDIDNLTAARSQAILNLLNLELAGPQAWIDYSVDGGSYQYAAAKRQLQDSIDTYTKAIQQLSGAWMIRSRSR